MMDWKKDKDNGSMFLPTGNGNYVWKDDFERVFGKSNTYNELINHSNTTKGWKRIFDDWREKGILP